MDLNRIALYLAGKFPPYYGMPFDKLELIEQLRAKSPQSFTEDFFKIFDSQDFYSSLLKRIERIDQQALVELIKVLNVPEDAGGLSKKERISEKLQQLKKEYREMDLMKDNKKQQRGHMFEKWLIELFKTFNLKPKAAYRTKYDQIDGSFELDGKEYLLEAKWTKKPSTTNVGDKMFARLNRCLIGTVGLIISKSGYTSAAIDTAIGHKNMLLIEGKDLERVLNNEISLVDVLRDVRRKTAEGKLIKL